MSLSALIYNKIKKIHCGLNDINDWRLLSQRKIVCQHNHNNYDFLKCHW